ncbi:uncharacterized protein LOC113371431 [Ctenocephalides felis]|uniref:uncharacterized protein LOC113371431 n=1 Tax=Ctenocephalides felis TaxID=7515 RepID=UPI000E6E4DD6|nr:uncharacterized protein LOC113371431 [Ctenocephalides felis]
MADFISSEGTRVKKLQYADDLIMYTVSHSVEHCRTELANAISNDLEWMRNNRLALEPRKTKSIIFTRHRAPKNMHGIDIDMTRIEILENIKILGVTFDKKLNFNKHISEILLKCEKGINLLKRVCNTSWGTHPNACLSLYKAIIRPHFDYGCQIYGGLSAGLYKKLSRAQFAAIRTCLGSLKSTPTNSLLAAAGEAPLDIRKQVLTNRFLIKKFNFDHSWIQDQLEALAVRHFNNRYWFNKPIPPLVAGFHSLKSLEDNIIISNRLAYYTVTWKATIPKKYIHLSDELVSGKNMNKKTINLELHALLNTRWEKYIQIYTDGSKTDDGVGCAVYIPSQDIQLQIKLPDWASIFTAELTAINSALDLIKEHNLKKAIILSDSMSSLHALNMPKDYGNPLIFDCLQKIEKLNNNNYRIELVWIRGHHNITGNEIADSLAKEAQNSATLIKKAPAVDLKRKITKMGMLHWQKIFDLESASKGILFRPCKPIVSRNTWFEKLNWNRREISTICRLRLAHTKNNVHLFRIGIKQDPFCSCSTVLDTIDHILWSCPLYERQRIILFKKLQQRKVSFPINARFIISSNNIDLYRILIDFVNESNIRL